MIFSRVELLHSLSGIIHATAPVVSKCIPRQSRAVTVLLGGGEEGPEASLADRYGSNCFLIDQVLDGHKAAVAVQR
jgi:hypothetical protein